MRQIAQGVEIDSIAVRVHRGRMRHQPEQPRATIRVVRDMPTNAARRRDDRITGLRQRHEGIQVRHCTRRHTHFGITCVKNLGGETCGEHLDLLNRLQSHLVLIARIAK